MRKLVRKIDANGFFIADVFADVSQSLEADLIDVPCPGGYHKPKWDGAAWVEGLTAEEIAAIPQPAPVAPVGEMIDGLKAIHSNLSNINLFLGKRLVKERIHALKADRQRDSLGKQLVAVKLDLMKVKGGTV